MSDFKTRLIQERDELQEKYRKLSEFMSAEGFKKLPKIQRTLLRRQHSHMGNYLLTLNQRLENL